MNEQKIMRILFIAVPVFFLLTIWWNAAAPFLSLAILFLMLLVLRNSGWVKSVLRKPREPVVYYQPPEPSPPLQQQEPPPQTNLRPGFDLTAEEYQQLSKQYQQGYQAQAPRQPTDSAMPKEASSWEQYEQPQAPYPQMPPMAK